MITITRNELHGRVIYTFIKRQSVGYILGREDIIANLRYLPSKIIVPCRKVGVHETFPMERIWVYTDFNFNSVLGANSWNYHWKQVFVVVSGICDT